MKCIKTKYNTADQRLGMIHESVILQGLYLQYIWLRKKKLKHSSYDNKQPQSGNTYESLFPPDSIGHATAHTSVAGKPSTPAPQGLHVSS